MVCSIVVGGVLVVVVGAEVVAFDHLLLPSDT